MTLTKIVARRLYCHSLVEPRFERAEDVVGWLGAVQAQDLPAVKWAVAQRTSALTNSDVERAFNQGAILRTHVLRPTWHLVLPADIRWMLSLTASRVLAACAGPFRQLGLDAASFRRSHAAIARALEGGRQLTRVELARVLGKVDKRAVSYLLLRAELDGVVCSGAVNGAHRDVCVVGRTGATGEADRTR